MKKENLERDKLLEKRKCVPSRNSSVPNAPMLRVEYLHEEVIGMIQDKLRQHEDLLLQIKENLALVPTCKWVESDKENIMRELLGNSDETNHLDKEKSHFHALPQEALDLADSYVNEVCSLSQTKLRLSGLRKQQKEVIKRILLGKRR